MAIMYVRDPDTREFVPVIGGGSSVEVDTTLTQSGKAADAKATGDALDKLEEATEQLIDVNDTEPTSKSTKLWIDPDSDEEQIPQIDDSIESNVDTWSSAKIAKEISNVNNNGNGGGYTLPSASATNLGGVKVGTGLVIDEDGVLSISIASAEGVSF